MCPTPMSAPAPLPLPAPTSTTPWHWWRPLPARALPPFGAGCIIAMVLTGSAPAAADGAAPGTLRQLTDGPTVNAMPHWSADGRRILFHSRRPAEERGGLARRKLWLMNADGSDAHAISQGPAEDYDGRFAPDGNRIAFVSEANGSRDIWIMQEPGGAVVPLTDDSGVEEHPGWSPDGEHIVYTAFPTEGGNFDLWMINRDGSGKRRLTSTAANEIFPTWHPDGEIIAYVTDAAGSFDLYALRVRDGTTFPLVTGPDHDVRPAWSPDGTKLAFARWPEYGRGDQSTLWLANADGSVPIELDTPPGSTHPAWAPDGRRLALQRRTADGWDVVTYEPPGDLTRPGRLHAARQHRGGVSDVVVLRTGERLTGTVRNTRWAVHAAYATLEFPRNQVASVRFNASPGLTRIVLVNGDVVSGVLVEDTVRLDTPGDQQRLGSERLESVALRVSADVPGTGTGIRVAMQNGDVVTATRARSPLHVRIAGQVLAVPLAGVRHAAIEEGGTHVTLELTDGEHTTGDLLDETLVLDLALGPSIRVRPGQIRSIAGPPGRGSTGQGAGRDAGGAPIAGQGAGAAPSEDHP